MQIPPCCCGPAEPMNRPASGSVLQAKRSLGDQGGGVRRTYHVALPSLTACSVTLSPVSLAAYGTVSQERGLSLRFPRFIRLRTDKSIEQASEPEMLVKMWKSQQRQTKGGADEYDLVDVDIDEEDELEEEDDSEHDGQGGEIAL